MIRSIVYRMENLNRDTFSRFLMPGVNSETIDDHIRISSPCTQATQVEVVAAASVFQVPLYYCTQDKNNVDKWNVVKPFFNGECPLKLPAFPQPNDSITLLMPTHFELFYYDDCHYDAIVSTTTGKVSTTPPALSTSHSDLLDLFDYLLWITLISLMLLLSGCQHALILIVVYILYVYLLVYVYCICIASIMFDLPPTCECISCHAVFT